jgi:ABC-type sugar transport system substrate-binding protein
MRARSLVGVAAVAVAALLAGAWTSRAAPRPPRIGLVVQSTELGDAYQRGVLNGAERAVSQLGVEVKTITTPPHGSSVGAFRYLARQGYDLILT